MGRLKEFFLGTRYQQIDRELELERQINAQYDEYCHYTDLWQQGLRTPVNASIKEFEYLNKPVKLK